MDHEIWIELQQMKAAILELQQKVFPEELKAKENEDASEEEPVEVKKYRK